MSFSREQQVINQRINKIDDTIRKLNERRMELCDDLRFCDYTLEEMEALVERKRYELKMMEQDDTFGLVLRQRQMEIYIDKLKEQIEKRKGIQ